MSEGKRRLEERIKKDILNIGCIYPTVNLWDEPVERLAGRIASTVEAEKAQLVDALKKIKPKAHALLLLAKATTLKYDVAQLTEIVELCEAAGEEV